MGVSVEGQLEAKNLQPNKTSHSTLMNNYTAPRTWPNSSISFYSTLLSLFLAKHSFFSHKPVAPKTRRVLADQHKTPKTSVKMSNDVSVNQQYQPIVCQ